MRDLRTFIAFEPAALWEIATRGFNLAPAYADPLPVGWDRERDDRSAGIRTLHPVAVGAGGFVLVGIGVLGRESMGQTRIMEGLITGVGLIGGGAILKQGGKPSGTATAASLWATGALGGWCCLAGRHCSSALVTGKPCAPTTHGTPRAGRLPGRGVARRRPRSRSRRLLRSLSSVAGAPVVFWPALLPNEGTKSCWNWAVPRTSRILLLLPLLALLPDFVHAQELDAPTPVGPTAQGALAMEMKSKHEHHRHGYQRVQGVVELREPELEAGRTVTKLEMTFDFDCKSRQLRTVRTTRRTWTGEYAGTSYSREAWRPPAMDAETRALRLVCRAPEASPSEAAPVRSSAPPRRSEPQVVVMPRSTSPKR